MAKTQLGGNQISDGTITDADISAAAAIAGTKIAPDFGALNMVTSGKITAGSLMVTTGPGAGKILTSDATGLATWQTPSGGGGAYVQVANQTLAVNGSSFPNITGLDLTTHSFYEFLVQAANSGGVDGLMRIYFNGDTTDANYNCRKQTTSSSVTQTTEAAPHIGTVKPSQAKIIKVTVTRDANGLTRAMAHAVGDQYGSFGHLEFTDIIWAMGTNVTSIQIAMKASTGTLRAGSRNIVTRPA
jgi:hypothetical protein